MMKDQDIGDQTTQDKILYVEKGKFYGHPNKKRAEYLKDLRQCVWRSPSSETSNVYQRPLLYAHSALVGMMEYTGNQFGGQLRGNLMTVYYEAQNGTTRLILSENGTTVSPFAPNLIPMGFGSNAIDMTQAPNGNLIEVRYTKNELHYIRPVEPVTSLLVVNTVFPTRGLNGGNMSISIYGENLNRNGPIVEVKVGSSNCGQVNVVSSKQVDCITPGGFGTNDIVVTNGIATSTLPKAYRYISGVMPSDFVLPVYTGV